MGKNSVNTKKKIGKRRKNAINLKVAQKQN